MFRIVDEESLILKEDEPITLTEVATGRKRKLLLENKKKLKEELKQAEYVEYDFIPLLRFQEIQANLNTIIEGYFEVGENLTYEKTNEIKTDLTRIENSLDNIATTLSEELKNNLIYKEG